MRVKRCLEFIVAFLLVLNKNDRSYSSARTTLLTGCSSYETAVMLVGDPRRVYVMFINNKQAVLFEHLCSQRVTRNLQGIIFK